MKPNDAMTVKTSVIFSPVKRKITVTNGRPFQMLLSNVKICPRFNIVCIGVSTPPSNPPQKHHSLLLAKPAPLLNLQTFQAPPPLFRQSPLYIGVS